MNICIIGAGASGMMVCTALKSLDFIKKIILISSPKIPTIGVGESTTYGFNYFLKKYANLNDFVKKSDAAVKYGVVYSNWSKNNFIHGPFKHTVFEKHGYTQKQYFFELMMNRNLQIPYHDLALNGFWNMIQNNKVLLDENEYGHTWHFNAAKFISYLKEECEKSPKVEFVNDTVVDCFFKKTYDNNIVSFVVTSSGKKIESDYYVNCSGENSVNENVFQEKYLNLSDYLLTDKAVIYPLKYKNKRKEFHPYTAAKTMKCGWRWITPTWSRIGTGYVFSSRHLSIDSAIGEFKKDIGDDKINPIVVEFSPKANKKYFKYNHCTIGMSSGFLEPLDAPGLSATCSSIEYLIEALEKKQKLNSFGVQYSCDISDYVHQNNLDYLRHIEKCNRELGYQWWLPFILTQYKTCYRNDTKFWKDQKNVVCPEYERIMNMLNSMDDKKWNYYEWEMLFRTISAKDIPLNFNYLLKQEPFAIDGKTEPSMHHLEYIQQFHDGKIL